MSLPGLFPLSKYQNDLCTVKTEKKLCKASHEKELYETSPSPPQKKNLAQPEVGQKNSLAPLSPTSLAEKYYGPSLTTTSFIKQQESSPNDSNEIYFSLRDNLPL